MQNKKTTHFLSSQGIVFDILNERSNTLIISHAFMPRKFLVGMSYVLANYVSELVGGLLGLIPTKYQLNNTLCSVGSNQKAIGIKQLYLIPYIIDISSVLCCSIGMSIKGLQLFFG
ncbi:hypothetical protein JWK39_00115 [Staphylococcus capitis]|uniref:hypothetical protein n=5 Tax=cellular organisms TaxID=131567 RepID=UPI001A8C3FAD|nr:hypothetical protein [Staphylococcus capitis]MBO0374362.1 hypothetical protein [Staphylococcus capitis]